SGIWKKLEGAVRKLDAKKNIFETYVISGPIFYFDKDVIMMGNKNEDISVTLPIPHAFFKSVLVEKNTGTIDMWSFIIPNKKSIGKLEDYLVKTSRVEKISGLFLWETLLGTKMIYKKNRNKKMWNYLD
ncbi:MAG: endonuclease G, partial [Granulosicoccus sp.]